MSFSNHNPEMFTRPTKCQLLCLQADAYFYSSQYKQAEVIQSCKQDIDCYVDCVYTFKRFLLTLCAPLFEGLVLPPVR